MPPRERAACDRDPPAAACLSGVDPATLSASALKFAHGAISANTHRTYQSGITRFTEYCKGASIPLTVAGITPVVVANWVAHLAESTSLTAGTIGGYKSALRSWFLELSLWNGTPNPFESPVASQIYAGVRRERIKADLLAKANRPMSIAIGPKLLLRLKPRLDTGGMRATMMWAAACLASHSLLRPNEFLGSYQLKDRAMRPEQIAFFAYEGKETIAPPGGPLPHRYTIRLGVTKADQEGANAPLLVDAPMAVNALWRWFGMRPPSTDPQLFRLPGESPLSIASLTESIANACRADGLGEIEITGKCFRRGGCSDMVAAGFTTAQIQTVGRWQSSAMVNTYADPASRRARAALGPAAPPR